MAPKTRTAVTIQAVEDKEDQVLHVAPHLEGEDIMEANPRATIKC